MTLQRIKTFIQIVDSGKVSKAADALFVSNSTISRHLSQLEENLGTRLIHRDSRNMLLTSSGVILYREGKKLLAKAAEIEQMVVDAGNGVTGEVNITALKLNCELFDTVCADFAQSYPRANLKLKRRENTIPLLSLDTADVIVTYSFSLYDVPHGYKALKLCSDRFCIAAAPTHPLALLGTVYPEDIARWGFIRSASESAPAAKHIINLYKLAYSDPEPRLMPTVESQFLQVRCGNGMALVPTSIARRYGDGCAVYELAGLDTTFDLVMLWRDDNENPTLRLFIGTVTKQLDSSLISPELR